MQYCRGSFIHVKWMDHFTFDPRLDGIGGGAHIFPNRAPTFVNPALPPKREIAYKAEVRRCCQKFNLNSKVVSCVSGVIVRVILRTTLIRYKVNFSRRKVIGRASDFANSSLLCEKKDVYRFLLAFDCEINSWCRKAICAERRPT